MGGKGVKENRGMIVLLFFVLGIIAGKICSLYVTRYLKKHEVTETKRVLRTPVFEIVHGVIWVITRLLGQKGIYTILSCLLLSGLLVVMLVDFWLWEIPPLCTGLIAGLGLIQIGLDTSVWPLYLAGALWGGGLFLLVYLLTGKRGIGGGDVKLMAAAGLVLGSPKVLFAMFLGCFFAVFIRLPLKLFRKENSTFALGPYLALGIGGMVWFGDKIVQWEQLLG